MDASKAQLELAMPPKAEWDAFGAITGLGHVGNLTTSVGLIWNGSMASREIGGVEEDVSCGKAYERSPLSSDGQVPLRP